MIDTDRWIEDVATVIRDRTRFIEDQIAKDADRLEALRRFFARSLYGAGKPEN